MTSSAHQDRECPACRGDAFEHWSDIDAWVCERCAFVLDSVSERDEVGTGTRDSEDIAQGSPSEWRQSVSVRDNSEATFVEMLSAIERIGTELSLSDEDILQASEFARDGWESNFMHGRTMRGTAAAVIYASTRVRQATIPPEVIASVAGVETSVLKQTYSRLKTEQDIDLNPPVPEDYLEYLCETLEVAEELETEARERLERLGFVGGSPTGTAAAVVYVVSKGEPDSPTLRDVAIAVGLTKETVWRHTNRISDK